MYLYINGPPLAGLHFLYIYIYIYIYIYVPANRADIRAHRALARLEEVNTMNGMGATEDINYRSEMYTSISIYIFRYFTKQTPTKNQRSK